VCPNWSINWCDFNVFNMRHLITLNRWEWTRDSLMNYLLEAKERDPVIKVTIPNDYTILSLGGLSDRLAHQLGGSVGQFYKTRDIQLKYTPCNQRAGISDFLGIDTHVEGRRCLVVDDIFTTGTTLREAHRVLESLGALSTNFLTLYRINYDTMFKLC